MAGRCNICGDEMGDEEKMVMIENPMNVNDLEEYPMGSMVYEGHPRCIEKLLSEKRKREPKTPAKIV